MQNFDAIEPSSKQQIAQFTNVVCHLDGKQGKQHECKLDDFNSDLEKFALNVRAQVWVMLAPNVA